MADHDPRPDHDPNPRRGRDPHDDLEALRRLKARYFRGIDTKDWESLRNTFTDTVEVDMTGEGGGTHQSADDFVAAVARALEGATSVHHGHMPELRLTSTTAATGIWAMEDRIWWPAGSPVTRLHGAGHYHEAYEKNPAGWRIRTMRLTRIFRHLYDAGGNLLDA